MLIKAFRSESTVEAFDKSILRRFAGLDERQAYPGFLLPEEHGLARKLGPVVAGDLVRRAALLNKLIQEASHHRTGYRVGDQLANQLLGVIIFDVQHPELTVIGELIRNKVHRPPNVAGRRHHHRHTRSLELLPVAITQLQAFLGINTLSPLVVLDDAFAAQHAMKHLAAQATVFDGQLLQSCLEHFVIGRSRLVAHPCPADACQLAGPSLADPEGSHQVHGDRLAARRRYHFFDSTSFMASTSNSLSAKSRLSLLFSDSSSFRRLASLTSRPANLLRQL